MKIEKTQNKFISVEDGDRTHKSLGHRCLRPARLPVSSLRHIVYILLYISTKSTYIFIYLNYKIFVVRTGFEPVNLFSI